LATAGGDGSDGQGNTPGGKPGGEGSFTSSMEGTFHAQVRAAAAPLLPLGLDGPRHRVPPARRTAHAAQPADAARGGWQPWARRGARGACRGRVAGR
jgi:hypothetical protein